MDNQPKFCPNCGAGVEPDARFCVSCGSALEQSTQPEVNEEPAQEAPETATAEPTVSAPEYNYYQAEPQKPAVSKKNSIMSMIFGLVALESAVAAFAPIYVFMFLPIAIVFAILGLKKSNTYVEEAGQSNAFSKVGKIVSIISIPLSVFFGIIGLVLTIVMFAEL